MAETPPSVAEPGADQAAGRLQFGSHGSDSELNLLMAWPDEQRRVRWRVSFSVSLALHLLLLLSLPQLKTLLPRQSRAILVTRRVTPLYLPPDLLSQRDPNRGKVSKTFDLADLMAAHEAKRRVLAPARGSVRRLEIPNDQPKAKAKASPQITVEAPQQVATNQAPPSGVPDSLIDPIPPAPAPPSNALPTAGSSEPAKPSAKLAPPKNSVHDVIHQMAKRDAGSPELVISDEGSGSPMPSNPGQQAAPVHMGSAIELQTNPEGADFKPYLTRILAIVRRNWFGVIPVSARMGALRGRTTLQFVVNRDGSIPKLIIADSSGLQPLDTAAVAGLSMSNPLPPLPADFKGAFIRLQFSFSYNVPAL